MKKYCALLLALILFFSVSCARAEETRKSWEQWTVDLWQTLTNKAEEIKNEATGKYEELRDNLVPQIESTMSSLSDAAAAFLASLPEKAEQARDFTVEKLEQLIEWFVNGQQKTPSRPNSQANRFFSDYYFGMSLEDVKALGTAFIGSLPGADDNTQNLISWNTADRQVACFRFTGEDAKLSGIDALFYADGDTVSVSDGVYSIRTTESGVNQVYATLAARCAAAYGEGLSLGDPSWASFSILPGQKTSFSRVRLYIVEDGAGWDLILHGVANVDNGLNVMILRYWEF